MLPVFALVGRPNVGKSTLFNRLTCSREAIVDDQPGVTRDRLYAYGMHNLQKFLAIDTGGLEADGPFAAAIRGQVESALDEANLILFIVDRRAGLVGGDISIGEKLRLHSAKVIVVVNKSEGIAAPIAAAEFQALGLGALIAISAKRGDGVGKLLDIALTYYPKSNSQHNNSNPADADSTDDMPATNIPIIALAGKPNVGKSTFANKLAGDLRVLVSDTPGTTRESIRLPLCIDGKKLLLIDTAGVRRKSKLGGAVEKFSVIRALQAIEHSNVVILMIDATGEIGFQDAVIAGMIRDLGRSMVVAINKWDGLDDGHRRKIKQQLRRQLPFLPDPPLIFLSALHGSNVDKVIPAAQQAYQSAMIEIATASLNRTLSQALAKNPPPLHHHRVVRLKFACQVSKNPPTIVIHGNRLHHIPQNYRRYLANFFARTYKLVGTPVKIILRNADNPYA